MKRQRHGSSRQERPSGRKMAPIGGKKKQKKTNIYIVYPVIGRRRRRRKPNNSFGMFHPPHWIDADSVLMDPHPPRYIYV
jgi:hypothetical protein